MLPTRQYHGAACKTCRRRGRKCTRELPTCHSCKNRGLECEGYELKWAGLASRGFLAGKDSSKIADRNKAGARKSPKATKRQQPREKPQASTAQLSQEEPDEPDAITDSHLPSPVCTPSTALAGLFSDEMREDDSDENMYVLDAGVDDIDIFSSINLQNALIPTPQPAMNFFEIPSDLSFILDYHLREVAAKLCVDNNALMNPYRQYIYPLALQRPALLYACAAMSSVHYSTRQQNETFFVEALRLRGKALSRLHESMWSTEGALDESNLATVLMLILCDMCMGGHSNFETYFSFAKSLMDARGPMRTRDNFVEQYISWLDVMSCASTSRKPVFSSGDLISLRDVQADWSYDVVPCAADVFNILQEVVDLYKNHLDAMGLATQIDQLKTRILVSLPRTERGMPWYHLTEAYRHAVLLYMLLLFELDSDEDEVTWLVSSIVQHAKSTPSRSGWSDQLLWPLFHAGLKITDPRRQEWLRERFREMQLSGGFRNVASARETLENVWTGQFSGKYVDLLVREDAGDMLVI